MFRPNNQTEKLEAFSLKVLQQILVAEDSIPALKAKKGSTTTLLLFFM